jgi:REP element-mobilizing transposase RayT
MPRSRQPVDLTVPLHISARCINKEWFRIPMPDVWSLFEDYVCFISNNYEIDIFAFVLMSNHFHLYCQAPKGNISSAMNYFMRETSRHISKKSGIINQVYGGPHRKTAILENSHFQQLFKYIYRNPVKAGICNSVAQYQFSTLHGLLGFSKLIIPAQDKFLFESHSQDYLNWLNLDFPSETHESIRKALRKKNFELSMDKNRKKPILT